MSVPTVKKASAEEGVQKPIKKGKELRVLDAKSGQNLCKFYNSSFFICKIQTISPFPPKHPMVKDRPPNSKAILIFNFYRDCRRRRC
jgi:hypothetical protein